MVVDANSNEDYNRQADFFRYNIGVNVIPALYKNKVPLVDWKRWQTEPIPEELHSQWKSQNKFRNGMGIVLGNVFHREDKKGQYLACLDTDNGLATELFKPNPEKTLVQQRKNAPDRAHTYFYSERPVKRKPASSSKDLKDKYNNNLLPKFELRCVGDIVYSGKHETGFYYEIIGVDEPISLNLEGITELEKKIKNICVKYGLTNSVDQPVSELFKDDYVIYEGENRSREIKRVMLSLLRRNKGILSIDEIKQLVHNWERKHCRPPYPAETGIFERNWKQAVDIVANDKPIEDFLISTATGKTTDPHSTIVDTAQRIMQESTFKTCTDNGELYYYNGKVYVPGQEWRIREQARQIIPNIKNKDITEIVSYIKDSTYIDRSQFDSDLDIIVVDNGLLNIHSEQLKKFSVDHLSLIKLPMEYRPEAKCPNIKKFLKQVMESEEDINDIIKLIGYCLLATCEFEIAVMLHGEGRNGKGTLLRVIEAFLGKPNYSNRSLQDLDNNRFAVADLFGKMANILADLKALKLKETGYFKMIVSGDTLSGEKKFKDAFGFRNRAKLFFSANEIPETEDKTDAFYRRWRLFPMYKKFDVGNGRNTKLVKTLTTNEELSGLLNWVLDGLSILIKDGGLKQDIDKIREEWERHTNDVNAFLYEKCTVDIRNTNYYTLTVELYTEYVKFCKERRTRPVDINIFGKKLAEKEIMNRRRMENGVSERYYEGVIVGLPPESWRKEPLG